MFTKNDLKTIESMLILIGRSKSALDRVDGKLSEDRRIKVYKEFKNIGMYIEGVK